MDELKGAIKLSRKMKEDTVQITSMDVNAYWNTIEETTGKRGTGEDICSNGLAKKDSLVSILGTEKIKNSIL